MKYQGSKQTTDVSLLRKRKRLRTEIPQFYPKTSLCVPPVAVGRRGEEGSRKLCRRFRMESREGDLGGGQAAGGICAAWCAHAYAYAHAYVHAYEGVLMVLYEDAEI